LHHPCQEGNVHHLKNRPIAQLLHRKIAQYQTCKSTDAGKLQQCQKESRSKAVKKLASSGIDWYPTQSGAD
jgi:hypothetical protein